MKIHRVVVIALVLSALTASFAAGQGTAPESPRMGGILKAAMIGESPSLDLHWTTAVSD